MHSNLVAVGKSKLLPLSVYFKENLKRFLIETSLNGLKYIEDVHRNIYERSYYLISFSTVFTAGIYMALYFLQKWQSTPVIISMSSRSTSINEMPFPTVTFCNMNQARASKVKNFKPHTPEHAMLQKICFEDYNYTRFRDLKPRFKGDAIDSFIIKNAQKCSDMIIYCKYGPNVETCTDLFREILLDEGICCVFNQLHPYFLYKGDSYKFIRDYTSSNGRTSIPVNWTLDNGYEDVLPRSYYPRKAAGVSMGLTVVLNAEIEEYYCTSTNGPGFKVFSTLRYNCNAHKHNKRNALNAAISQKYYTWYMAARQQAMEIIIADKKVFVLTMLFMTLMLLYNPVDAPHIKETGLPVMLGQQTRVRINARRLEAMPSLRNISPKERMCYFSDEYNLLYFKYYTRRNCEMECDSRLMLRRCGCVQYHMPRLYSNSTICFLDKMDCVVETERLILDAENLKCKENCISGCHDLLFFPDMFTSPLGSGDFNLQDSFFRNISNERMQKELAMVQIYFRDNFIRGNNKVPYTGFTEFLSQTGGIMSLMVGFSVISIAEVLYFVLLKPFIDMILRRNPKVLNNKSNENKMAEIDKFHHRMLFKRRRPIHGRVMQWNKDDLLKYKNAKY